MLKRSRDGEPRQIEERQGYGARVFPPPLSRKCYKEGMRGFVYYGIAAGVFALDRITKQIVEARISAFDVHPVIPGFFDLIHARNRGAAFSLFADSTSPWRPFFLIGLSLVALSPGGGDSAERVAP